MLQLNILPINQCTNILKPIKTPAKDKIEEFQKNLLNYKKKIALINVERQLERELEHLFIRTGYDLDLIVPQENNIDFVIKSSVIGDNKVLIEAKSPKNKHELISEDNINRKSLHELIWYFYHELDAGNKFISHLIITNGLQWYIFDAKDFHNCFANKCKLYAQYIKEQKYANYQINSADFYKSAEKYIEENDGQITCYFFNLDDITEKTPITQIKQIYKMLSPSFLLNEKEQKDANDINRNFYLELLHIIGLEEVQNKNSKTIYIKRKKDPNAGSLLELALHRLEDIDLSSIDIDSNDRDKAEAIALELSITWINRLLFLKLLETQIVQYKPENKEFLTYENIKDFSKLYELFIDVLGKKQRSPKLVEKYPQVPYLNSSLFELSELESKALKITALDSEEELPFFKNTVLKQEKKAGEKYKTLQYIFAFLDAYDFGREKNDDFNNNEAIINASVLGKVFEKINGYKDGSVYTPSFITKYMSENAIRRAILKKFNDKYGWNCTTIIDLQNQIDKHPNTAEYNNLINSIKLCDPAVGSGHFLVSALNYLIELKQYLGILIDCEHRTLAQYTIRNENDELIVRKGLERIYYDYNDAESQRIQKTLFNEKRNIIENCLFGVDINRNSVNICRLRLWIELLKHTYYTEESDYKQLETLPNIDINIKCGDSLLSWFRVETGKVLPIMEEDAKSVSNYSIRLYKDKVRQYKTERNKTTKQELQAVIEGIRSRYSQSGSQIELELTKKQKDTNKKNDRKRLFHRAVEWMFEFPEVLDDKGRFVGFDIVIGNPPYINLEDLKDTSKLYASLGGTRNPLYTTYNKKGDIYCLFVERAFQIAAKNGIVTYIMQNKWQQAKYGKELRSFFLSKGINQIVDFGDIQIFDGATTYPCIFLTDKEKKAEIMQVSYLHKLAKNRFNDDVESCAESFNMDLLDDDTWVVSSLAENALFRTLRKKYHMLETYVNGESHYGIKPGTTDAFIISEERKNELIKEDASAKDIIYPIVRGRNIKPYEVPNNDELDYLILAKFGSYKILESNYPSIYNWLLTHEKDLKSRGQCKGSKATAEKPYTGSHHWLELDNCPTDKYLNLFMKPKIMYQKFSVLPCFIYDDSKMYCNDSMWILAVDDKALLAILNSKLGWWMISKRCTRIQNGYQLIWNYFGKIFIPDTLPQKLALLADKVMAAKNAKADSSAIEKEIDLCVYKTYGLSYEDIHAIDSKTEITEEEYNTYNIEE